MQKGRPANGTDLTAAEKAIQGHSLQVLIEELGIEMGYLV
jgi:hypothetical protein